jgi:hypothetical protein
MLKNAAMTGVTSKSMFGACPDLGPLLAWPGHTCSPFATVIAAIGAVQSLYRVSVLAEEKVLLVGLAPQPLACVAQACT